MIICHLADFRDSIGDAIKLKAAKTIKITTGDDKQVVNSIHFSDNDHMLFLDIFTTRLKQPDMRSVGLTSKSFLLIYGHER